MRKYFVDAPAKVNLSLDVVSKRDDGYHEMRMINHSIALSDRLFFTPGGTSITLSCNIPYIPTDERNLVYRVAEKMLEQFDIRTGIHIDIRKRIPTQAGLAGGSADAAATILGLNKSLGLGMDLEAMYAFGSTIGADVPYCCFKGTALVEGIGEKITPLKPIRRLPVLVVKPPVNIATPWAFKHLDSRPDIVHPPIDAVIRCLETEDYEGLAGCMGNAFEQPVFEKWPEIAAVKQKMRGLGAFAAVMSGSGSTVVGYFYTFREAKKAYAQMKAQYQLTFLSEIE